jgi:hypothetical protein
MKKIIALGAAVAVACAVGRQVLPDVRRYLKMRRM